MQYNHFPTAQTGSVITGLLCMHPTSSIISISTKFHPLIEAFWLWGIFHLYFFEMIERTAGSMCTGRYTHFISCIECTERTQSAVTRDIRWIDGTYTVHCIHISIDMYGVDNIWNWPFASSCVMDDSACIYKCTPFHFTGYSQM